MTYLSPRLAIAAVLVLFLTGCGMVPLKQEATRTPSSNSFARTSGNIHGGQQPVAGALIQIYAVGITGDRSAATSVLTQAVHTDGNGFFDLAGVVDCTNTGVYGTDPLLYLVATGGNPGLGPGGDNPALALMSALGRCSSGNPQTFITVNEVTTIASVYALAPFMADATHIGSTSPTAMANAFGTVQALFDRTSGISPGSGITTGETVPTATLNSLANLIAGCVNSNGTGACTALFAATTPQAGATPTDTIAASLQIVRAPAHNASTLYSLILPTAPFQPSLSSAPSDWTLALTFTGGGLNAPSGIAFDASGNAWIANAGGQGITGLNNRGTTLTGPTGYTASGTIFGAQGVAVDRSNNVWLADTLLSKVFKMTVANGVIQQAQEFTTAINGPSNLAIDGHNNVWVVNFGDGSVTQLDNAGTPIGGSPITVNGTLQAPDSIAIDAAGNAWATDNTASIIVKFDKNQTLLSGAGFTDGALIAPAGIAIDQQGTAWVADNGSAEVSHLTAVGASAASSPYTGLTLPTAIAIDGAGTAWTATSGSLTQILPVTSAVTSLGHLSAPAGLAIDASGNVWTANSGDNTITKFIGLATPVTTPMAATVGP
jgi:sugar lactone lactonase YvrE